MKAGKLTESIMKRSVFGQLHTGRADVLTEPAIGSDFGAVEVAADEAVVLSCDTVAEAVGCAAELAVLTALNNVACSGAVPIGVLVSLLLPTAENEQQLRDIVQETDAVCGRAGVQVLGGHTEVTRAVKTPLITVTGVGCVKKEHLVKNTDIVPGMDILVTKWIGLEGTAILAREKEDVLSGRFSPLLLDAAKAFLYQMPVVREAHIAAECGAAGMHDISEGGIFGALWQMADAAGVGLDVDIKKIPIRQETIEICEFFDINPYKMISGGSLLIAAQDGERIRQALQQAEIPAAVIGRTTASNDRVLFFGEERRFLEKTQPDEIHRIF